MKKTTLKISVTNSKIKALGRVLGVKTAAFDILAGHTCPSASECLAKVITVNGKKKVQTGPDTRFVCYAAKIEAMYTNVYDSHLYNTKQTKQASFVSSMTQDLATLKIKVLRIHASGDFYSAEYTQKWIDIARNNPGIMFFGYTKVYGAFRMITDAGLDNLKFTFSLGSKDDNKLQNTDNTCKVVCKDDTFTGNIVCQDKTDVQEAADYFEIIAGRSYGINVH